MRIYISGPMSRQSFCRCDCPSTMHRQPIPANLEGTRRADAMLLPNVGVRHPVGTVPPHSLLVSDGSQGSGLPERHEFADPGRTPLPHHGQDLHEETASGVPVHDPLVVRLDPESIGRPRPVDTSDPRPLHHEVEHIAIGRRNLGAQRPLVAGAVNNGPLALEESRRPGDGSCPFHDFILPDDGVDPWDFNYPAFEEAAKRLTAHGFEPVSPTQIGQQPGWSWDDYMAKAIDLQRTCQGVYMLPGWRDSRGATVEFYVAQALGQRVWGAAA